MSGGGGGGGEGVVDVVEEHPVPQLHYPALRTNAKAAGAFAGKLFPASCITGFNTKTSGQNGLHARHPTWVTVTTWAAADVHAVRSVC